MVEKIILLQFIYLILLFFCFKYFLKNKILIHQTFGLIHKHNKKNKNILLIGGISILILILLNYFIIFRDNTIFVIIIYLIPIGLTGVFADLKKTYPQN